MLTEIIFYPAAISLVMFALIAVFSNKVVNSLLFSIVVFFLTGLIFYLLGAEYNAVMQLAIYGLAVPILLALALMFTNTRNEKDSLSTGARRYIIYFSVALILLTLVYLIVISFNIISVPTFAQPQIDVNSFGIFNAITDGFFTSYFVAFELVAVLLYAVVVGVSDSAK